MENLEDHNHKQKTKEMFKNNVEELFNIAHSNALRTNKIEEDKQFL